MTSFSTREVAKILGLSGTKIRSVARTALLAPRRGLDRRLSKRRIRSNNRHSA